MSAITLIESFGKPVTFHRYLVGSRVAGHWVPGGEEFLTIQNEKQLIKFSSVPNSGTWRLKLGSNLDSFTMNSGSTPASIQANLETIVGIGVGNVLVTGSFAAGFLVEFIGAKAATPMIQLEAYNVTLQTSGTDVSVTVETIQEGVAPNTPQSMIASVQPLTPREQQQLPEGQRSRETVKGYTTTALRTVFEQEFKKADVVDWEGRQFEVQKFEKWTTEKDLPHYKFIASLVEVD